MAGRESPSICPTCTLCSLICPRTANASISCTIGTKLGQAGIVVQGWFWAVGSTLDNEPSVATRIERPAWIVSSTIAGSPPSKANATCACDAGSTCSRKYL